MSGTGDSRNFVTILRQHFGQGNDTRLHTIVESGVHRGKLSEAILREFPQVMLFMVDSWDSCDPESPYYKTGDSLSRLTFDEQSRHMDRAIKRTKFAESRRTILRIPSAVAAQRVPCPRISAVMLDDSHALEDVEAGIEAWWPRIEPGGILAFHDYDHPRNDKGKFGVKIAVDEFAAREGLEVKTLGSCAWVVKPGEEFKMPPQPFAVRQETDEEGNERLVVEEVEQFEAVEGTVAESAEHDGGDGGTDELYEHEE
jgi:hypothetical protein